jgi:hypothetical protein
MRRLSLLYLVFSFITIVCGQSVRTTMSISGIVRDFEDHPIDSVSVMLMGRHFQPVVQAITDSNGYYSLKAERKHYRALAANSLVMNPRYERLEVRGVNAFIVQRSGSNSVFVCFRPMSLTRYKKRESLHDSTCSHMSMIGPVLSAKDVTVKVDGEPSTILCLTQVSERTKTGAMTGYLMQCTLPDTKKSADHSRITIMVTDPENCDKGEALLLWTGN